MSQYNVSGAAGLPAGPPPRGARPGHHLPRARADGVAGPEGRGELPLQGEHVDQTRAVHSVTCAGIPPGHAPRGRAPRLPAAVPARGVHVSHVRTVPRAPGRRGGAPAHGGAAQRAAGRRGVARGAAGDVRVRQAVRGGGRAGAAAPGHVAAGVRGVHVRGGPHLLLARHVPARGLRGAGPAPARPVLPHV